jgi:glycosyltransferase involved in cell wall biosynthesis
VRILLLNQTFYPDVASTAQHASDLATELVQRGHLVTVVCSQRAYDNPRERYSRNEVWRGVRIRRISKLGLGKKARWRRAADFGSYLARCLVHLTALPRFDLVIAMTSPPLISWLGALFVRVKGGRLVFWVMDLNPDEALAAGWLRPNSWTTRMLTSMLKYSLHRAEAIVALDRFMAKRIEDKRIAPHKITILPPWSHDHVVRYDAEGRDRFRADHGLDGKYVVMYSGNHSPCHPLTTLLEAARRLSTRRDIVFCFIGGGSEFDAVRRFGERHGLGNIVTLPYQPLDELSASLSSADLHVVVMGDAFVGIVHPCKVYNIRRLEVPYLYIGPTESHISEMRPLFTANHGNVEAVVRHIQTAADALPLKVDRSSENAPYSQAHVLAKMADTLERVGSAPLSPTEAATRNRSGDHFRAGGPPQEATSVSTDS